MNAFQSGIFYFWPKVATFLKFMFSINLFRSKGDCVGCFIYITISSIAIPFQCCQNSGIPVMKSIYSKNRFNQLAEIR